MYKDPIFFMGGSVEPSLAFSHNMFHVIRDQHTRAHCNSITFELFLPCRPISSFIRMCFKTVIFVFWSFFSLYFIKLLFVEELSDLYHFYHHQFGFTTILCQVIPYSLCFLSNSLWFIHHHLKQKYPLSMNTLFYQMFILA